MKEEKSFHAINNVSNKSINSEKTEVISKRAMRRKREREQRYQALLKSAEKLFAHEGYHKTSIEKIAELSELSVGALYFYFKNKEDLLIQLLDEIGFELRNALGSVFQMADFSLEGFKGAGYTFFEEFCAKNPEKIIIFVRESVGQSSKVEEMRKQIFDKIISDLTTALSRLSDNLGVRYQSHMSIEIMAVSIMGMFEKLAYHYLIWQNSSKDLKIIAEDSVSFIVGGINNLSIKL